MGGGRVGEDIVQDHTAGSGWSQVSALGRLTSLLVTMLFASLANPGEVCGRVCWGEV